MIKINLLPAEKRKAERTPLPRFFLIVINAAAFVLFAAGIVYFTLIKLPMVERDIKSKLDQRANLQRDVEKHDALQKDLEALKQKVGQIDQLTNRNIEWWQAVNAVWDVIQENPKVWIDDLKMVDGKGAAGDIKKVDPASKDVPPFGLSLRCHVSGDDVATLTQFRTSVKNNPILQRILPGINISVEWKKDDEKDYTERYSLAFSVMLYGKGAPPPTPTKPTGPTKPGAAAAPAK